MQEADLLRKEPRGRESGGHGRHRPVEREGCGGQIRGRFRRFLRRGKVPGGGDVINFMVISCNL